MLIKVWRAATKVIYPNYRFFKVVIMQNTRFSLSPPKEYTIFALYKLRKTRFSPQFIRNVHNIPPPPTEKKRP